MLSSTVPHSTLQCRRCIKSSWPEQARSHTKPLRPGLGLCCRSLVCLYCSISRQGERRCMPDSFLRCHLVWFLTQTMACEPMVKMWLALFTHHAYLPLSSLLCLCGYCHSEPVHSCSYGDGADKEYPRDAPPPLRFIRSCSSSLAAATLHKLEAAFHAPVLEVPSCLLS